MAEKVEVDIEVNSNIEPSLKQLRELKKQLKETAAGSAEFKKLSAEIRDVEDAIAGAKLGADDFAGALEAAPGPVGKLFQGLKKVELATKSWGAALKATGIGLIVSLVGGLVAAFSQTEGSLKKLEPLLIGLEKIFGGIVEIFTPLLDAFLEMALKALPHITDGIGAFYSVLVGFANFVKNTLVGVGKILKGVFTLDFDAVTEGYNQIKDAIPNAIDAGVKAFGRYEAGTKKLTKTEKENLKERGDANQKALEEKKKQMEAQDKLDIAALEKLKSEALAIAQTEQEKFDIEKQFADKLYQLRLKDLEDKQALEKKGSAEYKALQAEIIQLQAEKIAKDKEFAAKQIELTKNTAEELKKTNDEALAKEELDLNLQKEKGLIDEAQYQQALYDMRVKYANDNSDLIKAEIDLLKFKNEEKKKKLQEEREITALGIQSQIEELDRLNSRVEGDFAQDLERLTQKRQLLADAEANELKNTELTELQKTEVRNKYAKERENITTQEVAIEKAAQDAKVALQMEYADLFASFGQLLGQIAGKNKAVAIAGLLIEKGAAVAKVVTQMMTVPAILPPGIPNPAYIPARIGGALSIASILASTATGIQQINQAAASAGVSGGGGGSAGASTPPPSYAGAPTSIPAPQVQASQGMNASSQIAQTIGAAQSPIRAYVVSQDVSSQQALDRRTNVAATFSGG